MQIQKPIIDAVSPVKLKNIMAFAFPNTYDSAIKRLHQRYQERLYSPCKLGSMSLNLVLKFSYKTGNGYTTPVFSNYFMLPNKFI
jgi:hypothetical protein